MGIFDNFIVDFSAALANCDPRGITGAMLRVTNRCAHCLKGYFFFAVCLLTPLAIRNPRGITDAMLPATCCCKCHLKGYFFFAACLLTPLAIRNPRGITNAMLPATRCCKCHLKGYFFFCKKRSTPFHKEILPTFTKQLRKNYTIIVLFLLSTTQMYL